jgi:anti-sigma-K factor RskA
MTPAGVKEAIMAFFRTAIGASAIVATLATTLVGAAAHENGDPIVITH